MTRNIICPRLGRRRESSSGPRQAPFCGPMTSFWLSHLSTEAFAVKILGAFGQFCVLKARPAAFHGSAETVQLRPLRQACRILATAQAGLHGRVRENAAGGLEKAMVATTYRVSIDTIPLQNQREVRRVALSRIMRDGGWLAT